MERLTRLIYGRKGPNWAVANLEHDSQEIIDRLAAYEDTGLEPEEVKDLIYRFEKCRAIRAALCDPTGQPIAEPSHIRNLLQAEKSGRLVVLAVSPYLQPVLGNEMYICEDGEAYPIYVTGVEIGPNNNGEMVALYETLDGDTFLGSDIGKTVFLTRQEAEDELRKEEQNGKD